MKREVYTVHGTLMNGNRVVMAVYDAEAFDRGYVGCACYDMENGVTDHSFKFCVTTDIVDMPEVKGE